MKSIACAWVLAAASCSQPAPCVALVPPTVLYQSYCDYAPQQICFIRVDAGFWPPPLRVGGSLEIPYQLPGPLPAGDYQLSATGTQPSGDAHLHVDLLLRANAVDQIIASADLVAGQGVDGGTPGGLSATLHAAGAGACGSELVLRVKFVSGSSPYLEFPLTLTTP